MVSGILAVLGSIFILLAINKERLTKARFYAVMRGAVYAYDERNKAFDSQRTSFFLMTVACAMFILAYLLKANLGI